MQGKDDSLIAYNSLKEKIIDHEFCTLCGACEVACPTDALQIKEEKVHRLHDCSKDLDLCPICYEICPHSESLILRALHLISDAPNRNEALGYYRKIVLAQAADKDLRDKSRGGGVAASLLDYGVKKKIFDWTVYSQTENINPVKPDSSTGIIHDDVLSGLEEKYLIASISKGYGSAVFQYGKKKIAYVGIPCHVLALRKMQAWHHKMISSLGLTIGVFCFGSFSSHSLLEYLAAEFNIQPSEIQQMLLSTDFLVQTSKGPIKIPISEIRNHLRPGCQTCMDYTAELSDISVGPAYPLEDWSIVIIRTKAGEDFFYSAVENKVLNSRVIEYEPIVFERVVKAAMQKRDSALQAAKTLETIIGYLPSLLLRETETLARVKVEDIMTRKIVSVDPHLTVNQFLEFTAIHHHVGYPVVDKNNDFLGVVTLEDASQIEKSDRDQTLVSQIIHRKPITVKIGETALEAFKKMSEFETGRIVVVDPANPKKFLGIITKSDLMHTMIQQ